MLLFGLSTVSSGLYSNWHTAFQRGSLAELSGRTSFLSIQTPPKCFHPFTLLNSRFIYQTVYWHLHLGIFVGHKQFNMSKMYRLKFLPREVPLPVLYIMENGNSILLVTQTKWLPSFFPFSHLIQHRVLSVLFSEFNHFSSLHCYHPAIIIIIYPLNY